MKQSRTQSNKDTIGDENSKKSKMNMMPSIKKIANKEL